MTSGLLLPKPTTDARSVATEQEVSEHGGPAEVRVRGDRVMAAHE
jgi:hypothetical protein